MDKEKHYIFIFSEILILSGIMTSVVGLGLILIGGRFLAYYSSGLIFFVLSIFQVFLLKLFRKKYTHIEPKLVFLFVLLPFFVLTAFLGPIFKNSKNTNPLTTLTNISETRELKIPILMYHYIEYNQDERDFLRDQQNVPPHVFEQQIVTLKEQGYTFITPTEIPGLLKKRGSEDNKYVALTFDDGFRDFYTDAYPILKKHNVKAINYIPFYLLGGQDYMTKEMVSEIAQGSLVEIGSHTLNHAYLLNLPEDVILGELSLSKDFLKEEFGVEINAFAYPYGNFDDKTIGLVKKAGYTTAVTVEQGNMVNLDNLFTLSRIRPGHLTGIDLVNYISR